MCPDAVDRARVGESDSTSRADIDLDCASAWNIVRIPHFRSKTWRFDYSRFR